MKSEGSYNFTAKLYKLGINFCIDVPEQVSENFGGGNHIPVKGEVGGIKFKSTLVPRGKGKHRLFIHGKIWKKLQIGEGNEIEIWLELDSEQREPDLPEDLEIAIKNNTKAAKRFKDTTPTMRLRIVEWVNDAKKLSTRERRILTAVERLVSDGRLG